MDDVIGSINERNVFFCARVNSSSGGAGARGQQVRLPLELLLLLRLVWTQPLRAADSLPAAGQSRLG
jgi:hypothetical protein